VIITDKEMEALLFVMDDAPLISKLMARRGMAISTTERLVKTLRPYLERGVLPEPLDVCEKMLVKACIEDSDWPLAYAEYLPEELDTVHAVLRRLAQKLELLGVEVDRIAHAR
jgi:hypothetical protein